MSNPKKTNKRKEIFHKKCRDEGFSIIEIALPTEEVGKLICLGGSLIETDDTIGNPQTNSLALSAFFLKRLADQWNFNSYNQSLHAIRDKTAKEAKFQGVEVKQKHPDPFRDEPLKSYEELLDLFDSDSKR